MPFDVGDHPPSAPRDPLSNPLLWIGARWLLYATPPVFPECHPTLGRFWVSGTRNCRHRPLRQHTPRTLRWIRVPTRGVRTKNSPTQLVVFIHLPKNS